MKRVIVFILLKVAEILGAWVVLIQWPYCFGLILKFYGMLWNGNPNQGFMADWAEGFVMTIFSALAIFILWLPISAIPGWLRHNWKLAGKITKEK